MAWILTHTAVFLLTILVVLSPGVIWNGLLFRGPTPLVDRLLVLLAMGFSSWIAVLFVLCSTHLLLRPVVGAIAVALVLGAAIFARRLETTGRTWPEWQTLIVLLPTGVALGAVYLIALGPLPGIDAGHYHLTIPRLYVEAGGFRRIPFSVQSNWPLNGELLYAGVLLFSDHVSAGLLHFAFGLATSMLIYVGCLQAMGRPGHWAGTIGVALFWSNPIIQYDGWVANNDLAVTFFFAATFLAAWRALEDPVASPNWMFVAGVSAGLLAGTKINGAFAVLPVAIYVALRLVRERSGWSSAGAWLRWAGLPALLLAAVWPIKSWILTGNPFYPFLHGRLGGPEWSDALTARFQEQMLALGMGRSWRDYLLLPMRVVLFGQNDFEHFDGVLSRTWIVLVPAAIVLGWRRPFVRVSLFMTALLFAFWAAGSQQIRYLIPALAPLCLAVGVALVGSLGRWRTALGVAATVALLAASRPAFASASDWTSAYLHEGHRMPQIVIKPVYKYIDAKLPADARVLLINTNQTYFIRREFVVDSFFLASQVADWLRDANSPEEIYARLRKGGITHLLVAAGSDGTEYPPALLSLLQTRHGLQPLFRDAKNGLDLLGVCPAFDCGAPPPNP